MRWLRSAMAVLAFWLVLAIPVRPADLVWGSVVALLVGLWATRFLWPGGDPGFRGRQLPRLASHLFELVRAIVPAAIQLIAIVVRRRLAIRPEVFTYTTELKSDAARVALANSITLTPGTHCVDLSGDELTIHCLDRSFAESLLSGEVEAGVQRAFERGEWR